LRHALNRINGACSTCLRQSFERYQHNQPQDVSDKTPEALSLLSTDPNATSKDPQIDIEGKEQFRTLNLFPPSRGKDILGPRSRIDYDKPAFDEFQKMKEARYGELPTDVDWTAVWPTARVFHPATVPIPVRMGYIEKEKRDRQVVPSKWVNAELMKIPNFLHLTPKHIQQHCEALKKFCTPWPEQLKTDEDCHRHFPFEYVTSDYLYASPSLRDPRTRVVVLQFKLSALDLDYHAKDKFRRLLKERYDPKTDLVTITTDSCPLKTQNRDYADYIVTALYFESWKTEEWELTDMQECDWEKMHWDRSKCKEKIAVLLQEYDQQLKHDPSKLEEVLKEDERVKDYQKAVSTVYVDGEKDEDWEKYGQAVKRIVGL